MFKSPFYNKMKAFITHYFGGLYIRIDDHHVFLNASGLAFELFLCIIPFILIIFAVLGSILASNNIQYQINLLIDTIIPYEEYSEFVKKIIFTRINEVVEYKNIAGIVGGFGLFFAASGLFSSMRTILNQVFGITKSVNILLGKLRDFALVVMVIVIFFLTTICAPIIDVLGQSAGQFKELDFFKASIFHHAFLSLLSFTIIFVVFTVLYFTVPLKKLRKRSTFVSAFWAALLWETAKQLFGYYLYHFSSFGKIYGTYALVVVVAFWIYFSSVVFIVGAEIGKLFQERIEAAIIK
ncbi:MAG: YihY/virulence factor BrkB family protein [Ignavibacteriaceae bacterium]|nr:YihY/virulence factor BrkB family protein [Ignavibacteriaceae bacterium]